MLAVRIDRQPLSTLRFIDLQVLATAEQCDAVTDHGCVHDFRGVTVFVRHDAVQGLDEIHLAPEASKRLRQFASDRSRPDHTDALRQLCQRKDCFIREIASLLHPRYRWSRGARACTDGRLLELEALPSYLDRISAGEAGIPDEHIHPELRVTISRVVMTDPRTELPHPSHRRGEIVFHPMWDIEPEFFSFPDFGPCARGPDDTLGRYAPDIEAVSAHEMPLDQRHFGTNPGSDHSRHQPGRPGSNHNDVVSAT